MLPGQTYVAANGTPIVRLVLVDTAGARKTGITIAAIADLRISVIADNAATATTYTGSGTTSGNITEVTTTDFTLGTYSAPSAGCCRFKQVDATGQPGLYEIQLVSTWLSTTGKNLIITVSGTGLTTQTAIFPVPRFDAYSTAPDVNAAKVGGTTQTGGNLADLTLRALSVLVGKTMILTGTGSNGVALGYTRVSFYNVAGDAVLATTVISDTVAGSRSSSTLP